MFWKRLSRVHETCCSIDSAWQCRISADLTVLHRQNYRRFMAFVSSKPAISKKPSRIQGTVDFRTP
jgi:hypothetical protein